LSQQLCDDEQRFATSQNGRRWHHSALLAPEYLFLFKADCIAHAVPVFSFPQARRCHHGGVVVSIQVWAQQEHWTPLRVVTAGPTLASGDPTEGRAAFAFA
jgi:hypothetical protein